MKEIICNMADILATPILAAIMLGVIMYGYSHGFIMISLRNETPEHKIQRNWWYTIVEILFIGLLFKILYDLNIKEFIMQNVYGVHPFIETSEQHLFADPSFARAMWVLLIVAVIHSVHIVLSIIYTIIVTICYKREQYQGQNECKA